MHNGHHMHPVPSYNGRLKILIIAIIVILVVWKIRIYYFAEDLRALHPEPDVNEIQNESRLPEDNKSNGTVLVSVFYEALCPDSMSFFVSHLQPAFAEFPNDLNLDLIPYGKAKTLDLGNGIYTFECQHQKVECFANKIHACAINTLSSDQSKLLSYVTCLIKRYYRKPEFIAKQCAITYGINSDAILRCATTSRGDDLLKAHGDATNKLNPPLTFVPTVLLNGAHHRQASILKNFMKELCDLYKIC